MAINVPKACLIMKELTFHLARLPIRQFEWQFTTNCVVWPLLRFYLIATDWLYGQFIEWIFLIAHKRDLTFCKLFIFFFVSTSFYLSWFSTIFFTNLLLYLDVCRNVSGNVFFYKDCRTWILRLSSFLRILALTTKMKFIDIYACTVSQW